MAMGSNMSVWGKIWRGQIYNRYVDPPSSRKPKQSASLHWSIKLNMSFITNGLDTSKVYKRSQPPGGDVLTCLATLKQSQWKALQPKERKASQQRKKKLLSLHLKSTSTSCWQNQSHSRKLKPQKGEPTRSNRCWKAPVVCNPTTSMS